MPRVLAHPRLRWSDMRVNRSRTWRGVESVENLHLTYSGRGAIYQGLLAIRKRIALGSRRRVVLVPAFHCPTVVDPVLHAGFDVRFYSIDENLRIESSDLLGKIGPETAAVLFIRYFGISDDGEAFYSAVRDAGAFVIDDCSHSFLAANPARLLRSNADVSTFSFWKLVPSQHGGGLVLGRGLSLTGADKPVAPGRRAQWRCARSLGSQLLEWPSEVVGDALHRAHVRKRPQVVPKRVAHLPADLAYPYVREESGWAMPIAARFVLAHADLERVVTRRRENFRALGDALATCRTFKPVYRSIPESSCPWGLPLLMPKRKDKDYLLYARGVPLFTFGEVLHPALFANRDSNTRMIDASRFLSETLLVLSVHQGLRAQQLERFSAVVREFDSEVSMPRLHQVDVAVDRGAHSRC